MSYLSLLPHDISTFVLLPYIPPGDFDSFCYSCPRLESWCSDPMNIRSYLALHNPDDLR